MTDQSLKKDAGKPRMDLLPWNEFEVSATDYTVETVDQSLKIWWSGRPFSFDVCIPRRQLPGIAAVLAFGAAKYEPRGWEKGIPYSRIFAAAMRHADAYLRGDLVDGETGLAHESHFWCNVLFLTVFAARGRADLDDRPDPVPSVVQKLEATRALMYSLAGMSVPENPKTDSEAN